MSAMSAANESARRTIQSGRERGRVFATSGCYNHGMDADMVNTPEAFAAANRKNRREYLRSLTLETAAEDLEAILESWAEIETSVEGLDLPPRPPAPPPGLSIGFLLEGEPPGR